MKSNLLLRCLVLLLIAQIHAFAAVPERTRRLLAEASEPVRVVCIGDSITGVYYHSGSVRAYPEMLGIALQKLHSKAQITVRNAGISGDTSRGGLARLERDVLVHKPHLVTVMFGMNDLVSTPVGDFVTNMRQIVHRCREAGAEVVLCTQNSIVESPTRSCSKLAEFTEAIRQLAKSEKLGLADCHAAFEAVRSKDAFEWSMLLSDAIHPNMDGHKLFAETIAKVVTGNSVSLRDEPPPRLAMAHTLKLLAEHKPVQVFAMPPYDQHIATVLKQRHPDAEVHVKPWPVEDLTLANLENAAKAVRTMKPDLVIIAVPGSLSEKRREDFHQHYSWVMNWSLSFGPQAWDVIVAPPSTAKPNLTAAELEHEAFARRLIKAQDLSMIVRTEGDTWPLEQVLAKWVDQQAKAAN